MPDATIVRAVWKRADGSPVGPDMYSTQALASAVGARTVGGTRWRFRWAFADFAVWNARPGKYYDEGAAYPTAAVARTTTLTRAAPSMNSTAKLDHLANRSVVVRRGPGLKATARLRVTVDGPEPRDGPGGERHRDPEVRRLHVQGRRRSTAPGNGKVTVVFGTTVARVVVDHDERQHAIQELLLRDHPVRLFRGCAGRPEPQLHVPRGRRLTCPQSASALTGNGSAIGS